MAALVDYNRARALSSGEGFYADHHRRHCFHSLLKASDDCRRQSELRAERKKDDDVALLWFKHDFRSDDHSGLVAASQRQNVVPLYIFDHRILSRFSDEMLELVILALEDLREWLKFQGFNLMIRFGSKQVKATHVFSEEEVEYNLRRMIDIIEGSSVTFSWGSSQLVRWQTPFYDIKSLVELPASYRKPPIPHHDPSGSPICTVPTLADVNTFIGNPHKSQKCWTSIKEISAKTILRKECISLSEMQNIPDQSMRNINYVETNRSNMDSKDIQSRRVREKLRNAEIRSGASFGALLRSALSAGIISRRRVYFETITYEREHNAGFSLPFRYSVATVVAATNAVFLMERLSVEVKAKSKGYNLVKSPELKEVVLKSESDLEVRTENLLENKLFLTIALHGLSW
ncbi:hypothetical protein NE237_032904 [Protea cynaroides]|uniref:Photolyase/cryptochrome alpha/beta domain-containing protein n=1 Tax=Protea cynaroides TaxID=273540 RepID=A0A9Q0L481_9MAGN|nr:hypothetical protein NE237_032904 [Protea cynaroides]